MHSKSLESQLGLVKDMALREPCELTKEKCLKGGTIVCSKEKKSEQKVIEQTS